jgi:hypothetical protein
MKREFVFSFCLLSAFSVYGSAQSPENERSSPPVRLVVTDTLPAAKPVATPAPVPQRTPIVVGQIPSEAPSVRPREVGTNANLGFREIKSMIAEAKRHLQTRPLTIASVGGTFEGIETVRVAFLDRRSGQIDYVVMTKEAFLSTAMEKQAISEEGLMLFARTIRGNGVNTPITLTDETGMRHLPFLVQYPRVTNGRYEETAYYISTHPGLVTPEIVNAGKFYVRNVIEIAREKLRGHGIRIDAKIADIAERLAAVEHVDHLRFRTENHRDIYNDIYMLFALNEGQTYRYAVSSAGAGGMVQMIPSTYRMVRSWHPNVGLMPDFVEGMRDHVNASQAMLLYMQRTWNDLQASQAVRNALETGIATQEQLMAAGYNSNPARLPGYINRGGEGWTNLIPRETRIYLQIYASVDSNVPMTPRTR